MGDAEQSVTYADRSGDAEERMVNRTTHADALHQAGRRAEAETRFREAEQMQAESQPGYPLLYSLQGFKYCDLLLAAPERAAWRLTSRSAALRAAATPNDAAAADPSDVLFEADDAAGHRPALLAECRAVSQRAAAIQKRRTGLPTYALLDIALDHLTLGRAALYEFILGGRGSTRAPTSGADGKDGAGVEAGPPDTALRELDAAVAGLRRAGQQDELPKALLTRAWLRFLTGSAGSPKAASEHFARAQEDLDEAWEIAERGPMKLHMADIHLTRARLFGARNSERGARREELKYPWTSPAADLAAAEKLIHACGYHRRDEELADAKQALGL